MYLFIGILLACSLAAFFPVLLGSWRKRSAALAKKSPTKRVERRVNRAAKNSARSKRTDYKAASVRAGADCCQAARRADGKRILLEGSSLFHCHGDAPGEGLILLSLRP